MQQMTHDEWLALVGTSLDELIATHLDGANTDHPHSQQLHDWSEGLAAMFEANHTPDIGDLQTLCALLTVAVDRIASRRTGPPIPPRVGQALGRRAVRRMDGTR